MIASADLLVIDGNGKVVDTLRVVVSPLRPKPEENVKTFNIVRPGYSTSHLMCADRTCINARPKIRKQKHGRCR